MTEPCPCGERAPYHNTWLDKSGARQTYHVYICLDCGMLIRVRLDDGLVLGRVLLALDGTVTREERVGSKLQEVAS